MASRIMSTSRTLFILVGAAGIAASLTAVTPASAMRGADTGDSYINDLQHRPELIEPGGYADPTRYRIGNPQAGYDDRQLARQGIYSEGSGYYPPRPRGRVFIQPYYAR